jgi:hypothetical protein
MVKRMCMLSAAGERYLFSLPSLLPNSVINSRFLLLIQLPLPSCVLLVIVSATTITCHFNTLLWLKLRPPHLVSTFCCAVGKMPFPPFFGQPTPTRASLFVLPFASFRAPFSHRPQPRTGEGEGRRGFTRSTNACTFLTLSTTTGPQRFSQSAQSSAASHSSANHQCRRRPLSQPIIRRRHRCPTATLLKIVGGGRHLLLDKTPFGCFLLIFPSNWRPFLAHVN